MLRSVVNYANNSAGNVSGCERRSIHRLPTGGRSSNERTVDGMEIHREREKREGKTAKENDE